MGGVHRQLESRRAGARHLFAVAITVLDAEEAVIRAIAVKPLSVIADEVELTRAGAGPYSGRSGRPPSSAPAAAPATFLEIPQLS